jgi:hypothetical protein
MYFLHLGEYAEEQLRVYLSLFVFEYHHTNNVVLACVYVCHNVKAAYKMTQQNVRRSTPFRSFPMRNLSTRGQHLSVTFGEAVNVGGIGRTWLCPALDRKSNPTAAI